MKKPVGFGMLGPNWEGPYHIIKETRPDTYQIEDMIGKLVPHQ